MENDLTSKSIGDPRYSARRSIHFLLIFLLFAASHLSAEVRAEGTVSEKPDVALLWRQADVGSRNLFYGPGGAAHEPRGTMTFEKEDHDGSNPKYDLRDRDGTKWKAKLATEARPETAASRLLWAIGFYCNEDYFVHELKVKGIPAHLQRGRNQIDVDGTMHDVRLKRYLKGEKKIDDWHWKKNPFSGTREFNGLRVMMALLNNWDLKDVNNAVYEETSESASSPRIYMVGDLGATFGTTGRSLTQKKSKGNLEQYRRSKFISKVKAEVVDFNVPTRPCLIFAFGLPTYIGRLRMRWIGKDIPRTHAKWIAGELSKLSPEQIRDAFRSAGYSPTEVDGFATVVEERIAELNKL